jgi:hypothetical protein
MKINNEKITRFLNDVVMAEAVKRVLLESFMKPSKDTDVQTLAASRIAIDLLNEGWKELQKYKQDDDAKIEPATNPGL